MKRKSYANNLTVSNGLVFSSSHIEGRIEAAVDMITNEKYLSYLRFFKRIRQDKFIQDDRVRSKNPLSEREVTVIRGSVAKGVYHLLIDLKQEAEGMIYTHFNGDISLAEIWIAEELKHRLEASPELLDTRSVHRSVLATLPIVTKTIRNDYKSVLDTKISAFGIEWVRRNLSAILSVDSKTFDCANRHHANGNLIDSREDNLLNATMGSHTGVHKVLAARGIMPLSDEEALMDIGHCDMDGVTQLRRNIQIIHFSPEFRELLNVSNPRDTFILRLNSGDLFRDNIFEIVEKYGFSIEMR